MGAWCLWESPLPNETDADIFELTHYRFCSVLDESITDLVRLTRKKPRPDSVRGFFFFKSKTLSG